MIQTIKYHIKASLRSVTRHLPTTIMSATAVTLTLLLISAFMIVAVNISEITTGIANDVRIQATIDTAVTQERTDAIKKEIEAFPEVKEVVFSDKHQELEKFIKSQEHGDESFGQYRGDQNPLRDSFYVELKGITSNNTSEQKNALRNVTEKIKQIQGIVEAQYGGSTVENLVVLLSRIRLAGFAVAIALAVLSTLLIQNTIKSAIYSRQREISIMRNVGASNGFIKVPFMLEGVYIGILGSIIPIAAIYFSYEPLYNIFSGMKVFTVVPPYPFVLYISLGVLAVGIVVGLVGSLMSVNKYLRFKR